MIQRSTKAHRYPYASWQDIFAYAQNKVGHGRMIFDTIFKALLLIGQQKREYAPLWFEDKWKTIDAVEDVNMQKHMYFCKTRENYQKHYRLNKCQSFKDNLSFGQGDAFFFATVKSKKTVLSWNKMSYKSRREVFAHCSYNKISFSHAVKQDLSQSKRVHGIWALRDSNFRHHIISDLFKHNCEKLRSVHCVVHLEFW